MNCQNCGASLRPDATRCAKCGSHYQYAQPAQQAQQYAPQPQAPMMTATPPQQYAQPAPQYQQTPFSQPMDAPRSKLVAALLAIFLGIFGIHNFYLGHVARGIIQLVLTLVSPFFFCLVLPVVWVWSFIEFILILTGSLRDKYNRPLI